MHFLRGRALRTWNCGRILVPYLWQSPLRFLRSSGIWVLLVVVLRSLDLAVNCLMLVLPEECVFGFSVRLLPVLPIFRLAWIDSGHMLLPVYGSLWKLRFRKQRNAWSSVVHAMRQSRSWRISMFFCIEIDLGS